MQDSPVNSAQANAPPPSRNGNLLVLPAGVGMPRRCIFCNREAADPTVTASITQVDQKSRWTFMLATQFGLLGALIAASAGVSPKGRSRTWKFNVYMCDAHRKKNNSFPTRMIIGGVVVLLAAVVVGILYSVAAAMLAIFVGMIALAIYATLGQRRLILKKKEGPTVFAKGAGPDFLNSLGGNS